MTTRPERPRRAELHAVIDRFIETRCRLVPTRYWLRGVRVSELREAYENFCREQGVAPASRQVFNERLWTEWGLFKEPMRRGGVWVCLFLRGTSPPVGDVYADLLDRIRPRHRPRGLSLEEFLG
jgi:hypothetical protein